jgi:hypothetical protein
MYLTFPETVRLQQESVVFREELMLSQTGRTLEVSAAAFLGVAETIVAED